MGKLKLIKSLIILFIIFILNITFLNAQSLDNTVQRKKTSFNEVAEALSDKSIGNLFPMHDLQVNQILRMCDKGADIPGSINAMSSLGIYLGNEIEIEEELVIIRGSKVDINIYTQICETVIKSFKKPANTSIVEANNILTFIESGKGPDILKGVSILSRSNYRMRTGSELIINNYKLELWADVGKLNEAQFQALYKSLRTIGLQEELNEITVTTIVALVKENKHDEILKAIATLSETQWRCEGELDKREQTIIQNLINNIYHEHQYLPIIKADTLINKK